MAIDPGHKEYLCQVFNGDDDRAASHGASQAFVQALLDKVIDGRGFLPFIGAGFSVTAGIPIIQQLLNYLQRCICAALGADPDCTSIWNPRTDQWPLFIDRHRTRPNEHWIRLMESRLAREVGRQHNKEPDVWTALYQEGLGAMAEWRTALHFLSRLVLVGKDDDNLNRDRPSLDMPDQDVVDACWREVMRGKRPTLNHRMLAAVSGLLRVDLILTTNFDGLIEEAFDESRDPLEVFDVHMGDGLPSLSAVSRQRSIIKMHGSQRSLRADYSLDGLPRYEDIATLFDYIAGRKLTEYEKKIEVKNHLLIAGVGGNERRTFEFIRRSLERFQSDKLEVFWIAYSKDEISKIKEFFAGRPGSPDGGEESQIHIVRHTDAGLLFLHMYQWFRKSLPSTGSIFPSTTRLSFPPLPWQGHDTICDPHCDIKLRKLEEDLTTVLTRPNTEPERVFIVPAARDVYGVCTAAARLYRKLERDNMCLWIDMNDIYSADNLFEAFQEAASYRLGEKDWTPLYAQKDESSLGQRMPLWREVKRIIQSSNRPWILFLDAREIPGSNHDESAHPNGWMDEPLTLQNAPDTKNREAILYLLMQFASANPKKTKPSAEGEFVPDEGDERTLRVVLLCNQDPGHDVFVDHLNDAPSEQYAEAAWEEQIRPFAIHKVQVGNLPPAKTVQQVVEDVIEWTQKEESEIEDRRRFVQALVSMQRPRHFAVAWARCSHPNWTLANGTDTKRGAWLDELGKQGLLRRMDGGFIWFQAKYREALRCCLRLTKEQLQGIVRVPGPLPFELSERIRAILIGWGATAHHAEVHIGLTTWYRKVFDATEVAPAILEVVDHLCESARCLVNYPDSKPDHGQNLADLAASRVATARELLREHQFLIQSQGHPRATLRRLMYFQDFWVKKDTPGALRTEAVKFQSTIAEVCRVILREIGEDGEAYDRQRDVALYMTEDTVLAYAEVEARSRAWYQPRRTGRGISLQVTKKLTTIPSQANMNRRSDWRIRELVRWWRLCGMLALWTRSHAEASHSIGRALYVARNWNLPQNVPLLEDDRLPPDNPDLEHLAQEETFLSEWLLDSEDGHKFHLEVLHSLELAAYCLLLRAHTTARSLMLKPPLFSSETMGNDHKADLEGRQRIRSLLDAAGCFSRKGLQFVEQVQNNGMPSEDHDLNLSWCKSRLLMVGGLALDYVPARKGGRHAMSMLTDAAACLKHTTPVRGHSDLAIVEMRRAEVRLREAAYQPLHLNLGEPTDQATAPRDFEAWTYDRLLGDSIYENVRLERSDPPGIVRLISARESIEVLRSAIQENPGEDNSAKKSLRIVKARTMDALRYLDRAEPILRERRRNVWWTTWYFERRLRAMSMLLWVAAAETSSPIPFLGLEAVMEGTDTALDLLLEDSKRMVRADSYRLAMVILSYASCARALQIRLSLRPSGGAMNRRLEVMRKNIDEAAAHLKKVDWVRNESELGRRSPMDELSREVVRMSQERILYVLKGLDQPA